MTLVSQVVHQSVVTSGKVSFSNYSAHKQAKGFPATLVSASLFRSHYIH